MPPPEQIELPFGRILFAGNEVTLESTIDDPPKWRLACAQGLTLGGFSASRMRPDGVQDEMGVLLFKVDERYRGDPDTRACELVVLLHNGNHGSNDRDYVEAVTFRHDGIWAFGKRVI